MKGKATHGRALAIASVATVWDRTLVSAGLIAAALSFTRMSFEWRVGNGRSRSSNASRPPKRLIAQAFIVDGNADIISK